MRRIQFIAQDEVTGDWVSGYPLKDPDVKDRWYIMHNYSDGTIVNPETIREFAGITDKKGVSVYEGDIVRAYTIATEYQTHYGDNIPNGAYTEPCGVISKVIYMPVVFAGGCFTTSPLVFDKEEDMFEGGQCILAPYNQIYDREMLNNIFMPSFYGNREVPDNEFIDIANDIAQELQFGFSTIEQFINTINGFEVVGNIYEHPHLLNTDNNG